MGLKLTSCDFPREGKVCHLFTGILISHLRTQLVDRTGNSSGAELTCFRDVGKIAQSSGSE